MFDCLQLGRLHHWIHVLLGFWVPLAASFLIQTVICKVLRILQGSGRVRIECSVRGHRILLWRSLGCLHTLLAISHCHSVLASTLHKAHPPHLENRNSYYTNIRIEPNQNQIKHTVFEEMLVHLIVLWLTNSHDEDLIILEVLERVPLLLCHYFRHMSLVVALYFSFNFKCLFIS